jgi:hypothetical protein
MFARTLTQFQRMSQRIGTIGFGPRQLGTWGQSIRASLPSGVRWELPSVTSRLLETLRPLLGSAHALSLGPPRVLCDLNAAGAYPGTLPANSDGAGSPANQLSIATDKY